MSVSFYGIDCHRLETTPFGDFPARVYLHDDPDADLSDPRSMNLANDNARPFLTFLGIDCAGDLYGEAPLPDVRRAIIRARATFRRRAGAFLREDGVVYGEPCVNDDGTVELRPLRVWSRGIDEYYLRRQLDRLEELVAVLEKRGATHLGWG